MFVDLLKERTVRFKKKGDLAILKAIGVFQSPLASPAAVMGSTEVQGDPPPLVTSTRSWVAVAQKKQVLQIYEIDITTSDGKQSVEVPSRLFRKKIHCGKILLLRSF